MKVETPHAAKFMTVKGVALHYAVSPETIRKLIRGGKFPRPMKIGSSSRWAIAVLDRHDAERFAETE